MKGRIDPATLREMAGLLADADRDEMAIPSYLHKNPALRWMAWRRVELVAQGIDQHLPEGGRALDFGCGSGVLFGQASARASRVYGADLVLDAAALWKQRQGLENVELLRPDEIPNRIAAHSLDLVIAAEVLEHVDLLAPVLTQFTELLRPQGVLLVSLPTENRLYRLGRRLAGFHGHYHHANARSIDREISAAGFQRKSLRSIPGPGPLSVYWVMAYQPGA